MTGVASTRARALARCRNHPCQHGGVVTVAGSYQDVCDSIERLVEDAAKSAPHEPPELLMSSNLSSSTETSTTRRAESHASTSPSVYSPCGHRESYWGQSGGHSWRRSSTSGRHASRPNFGDIRPVYSSPNDCYRNNTKRLFSDRTNDAFFK
jgi:hypothetical protein